MLDSLRMPAHAAAVTVVIGMSAVATTHTSADVKLSGYANPLAAFVDTVLVINNDLSNGVDVYGDYEWQPFQGLVPELAYIALPIATQLVYNWSANIGSLVESMGTSVKILADAAWDLPAAVVAAAKQVGAGDIAAAIATLTNATLVPLKDAASAVQVVSEAILSGVVYNASAVLATLPGVAQRLLSTTAGALTAVAEAVGTIATQTVSALASENPETAWNTVVNGLFGPVGEDGKVESSLPGTLEAVTLGPGLGPSGFPNGYAVPSYRMWAEQSQLQLANAIGAGYPVPAVAHSKAATRLSKSAPTRSAGAAAKPATAYRSQRAGAASRRGAHG